eukprot:8266852-Pyramimonas_sp.AAC.1
MGACDDRTLRGRLGRESRCGRSRRNPWLPTPGENMDHSNQNSLLLLLVHPSSPPAPPSSAS